jgi:hypothetical protein
MGITSDLAVIAKADTDKYLIAKKFYEGNKVQELFSNKNLAVLFNQHAVNYKINIARRAVDAVVDKLGVTAFSANTNGAVDDKATKTFDDLFWKPNKAAQKIADAVEFAEEFGDAYLLVWPSQTDPADIDMIVHNPIGARLFYDEENETLKERYVRTWLVRGPGSTEEDRETWYRRVNIIDAAQVEKLISTVANKEIKKDSDFVPFVGALPLGSEDQPESEPGITPHDYGEVPVFHLRTKRPYGIPEHECLYGCQNLLIKTISTLAESIDGFGVPFRYRMLKSEDNLKAGRDVFGPEKDRGDDKVPVRAGSIANLYDTENVGQLLPADVQNLLDPVDKIMSLAATVSTTPLDYFDASAAAASGESKKEHKGPYHTKVQIRQDDFDATFVDAFEFVCAIVLDLGDVVIDLEWKPIQEIDRTAVYAQIAAGVAAGIPFEVVCAEAGYDPAEVAKWLEPGDWPMARADLFAKLATGVRDLAAASTLGVGIDMARVTQLLSDAVTPPAKPEAL